MGRSVYIPTAPPGRSAARPQVPSTWPRKLHVGAADPKIDSAMVFAARSGRRCELLPPQQVRAKLRCHGNAVGSIQTGGRAAARFIGHAVYA